MRGINCFYLADELAVDARQPNEILFLGQYLAVV
jgi:hypothetical protein